MSQKKSHSNQSQSSPGVQTLTKTTIKTPSMYRVVLLNDDYTPMDFVVWVLQHVFYMSEQRSNELMMQVHSQGKGVCGVYSFDIAHTKKGQVDAHAEKNEHPLKCIVEPDGGTL
tara:strand:- start:131 stop:472 length:342 start_codon:yes stop_codon:yes gene_type:complete